MDKKCSKCKKVQPLENFNKSNVSPDRKLHHCKSCVKVYYQARTERLKEFDHLIF